MMIFFISNTESEGGFGGANVDENGSEDAIPNEGAQEPNFAVMVKVGVGPHEDVNLLRGLSLVQITSKAILRLFGNLMPMVVWSILISGHFDKVLLSGPS